jgi:hypothetical protein
MLAKDILRLVLLVLFVAFALRSARIPRSVQIKSTAETKDTERQQLLQRMKDNRELINQEPVDYEKINGGIESSALGSGVNFSAGPVIMIIALLPVFL